MNHFRNLVPFVYFISIFGCAQENITSNQPSDEKEINQVIYKRDSFLIEDFFSFNPEIDLAISHIFDTLSNHDRISQLLMPAIGKYGEPKEKIDQLIESGKIGGLLMLNGTKEEFKEWISQYNSFNLNKGKIPFLYSADAEVSLINRKILGTTPLPKANTLQNRSEVKSCAEQIAKELNEIGINYNFAPVIDMTPNKTVGWRSFGYYQDSIIEWSKVFIEVQQNKGILTTAKHFPGHGNVIGDTHEKLVYIDGEMKEINSYPPVINANVMSVMIGHIAVKNNEHYNTNNQPATNSKIIVSGLLRDSLQFKGLIVTDALNMGGIKNIANASVMAIEAGCDILLMPLDTEITHNQLLKKYEEDNHFKKTVDSAVRRILRAKIVLGLITIKN